MRMRRMTGRRFRRGSATLFGAVGLAVFAVLFIASWHAAKAVLFLDESDRERGRMWGQSCIAAHRAVQSGRITAPGAPVPGPVTAPAAVTPAALRGWSLLPAGMRAVDEPGALAARYGAVLVDNVPMAVCSLSGTGIASRYPALRAGAVMAGIDVVGEVGGTATAMHAHLAAVQGVLGTLARGSLFVTADFGLGHPVERVHRRPVGGRPELSNMDRGLTFDGGAAMVGVGTATAEAAEADSGAMPATGNATVRGDVVLRSNDPLAPASLSVQATTAVSATGGFGFGGTQAGAQRAFTIPRSLGIGTSMRSRGAVEAGRMAVSGLLDTGGNVTASGSVAGGTVATTGEVSAESGAISRTLRVDSCDGCRPPPLGR